MAQVGELSTSELSRWHRYWNEEKWGPIRDNLHAALIITNLLRPQMAEGSTIFLDDYMLKHPDDIEADKQKLLAAQAEVIDHKLRREARRKARSNKK